MARPCTKVLPPPCFAGTAAVRTATRATFVHPTSPTALHVCAADTAIWRAVMPQPDWWPKEPGSYCIWGTPPNTVLAFSLNDGMLAWQV